MIPVYLAWYLRSFKLLSTRRPASGFGGISPIPLQEIESYMNIFGSDDPDEFVTVMVKADQSLIKHFSDRAKTEQEAKAKSGRSGKNGKG